LDDAWDKMVEGLGGIAACNNLPQEEQALEHAIMIKKTCKPAAYSFGLHFAYSVSEFHPSFSLIYIDYGSPTVPTVCLLFNSVNLD
jgi:hypothetical protein